MAAAGLSRAQLDALVDPVGGWLSLDEAWALHQAARLALQRRPAPVAVELGSWKGRSTVALASAFATGGRGVLHAVDPHTGTGTHARAREADTQAVLRRTLTAAGVAAHVSVVASTSREARAAFAPRSVDLLFVDASHHRDDVADDLAGWAPLLAGGATAALHDVTTKPGVAQVVRERVLPRGSPFAAPRLVGSTLLTTWGGPRASRWEEWWVRLALDAARTRHEVAVRRSRP